MPRFVDDKFLGVRWLTIKSKSHIIYELFQCMLSIYLDSYSYNYFACKILSHVQLDNHYRMSYYKGNCNWLRCMSMNHNYEQSQRLIPVRIQWKFRLLCSIIKFRYQTLTCAHITYILYRHKFLSLQISVHASVTILPSV